MNINEDNELNNYQIMYVTPVEAYTLMESSMDGLSEEQVSHRLKKYGKNEISKKKQSSMFKKLISNFTSLMALLLWGGGLLAILSGTVELGISIFCVNLINGFFSFFQEFKAEKAGGSVEVTFTFDASALAGQDVVVFEKLYYTDGKTEHEIASHEDLKDEGQTVHMTELPKEPETPPVAPPVKTGDETPLLLYAGIAIAALAGASVLGIVYFKRKKKHQ